MAFELLWLNGTDLRPLPLSERRRHLQNTAVLLPCPPDGMPSRRLPLASHCHRACSPSLATDCQSRTCSDPAAAASRIGAPFQLLAGGHCRRFGMTAPQRIEVITRGERRRRWSIEEKREIVAEPPTRGR